MAQGALGPLTLVPRLDSRLWGGDRLGAWLGIAEPPPRLAEAWLVYDDNEIAAGPCAGQPLRAAAEQLGAALLGHRSVALHGARFPLLAKLIDARDRLSVQVHPDDAYARSAEAASGFAGKSEAWYFLETSPGADVFLGLERTVTAEDLRRRALDGTIVEVLRRMKVTPEQAVYVPARTIHAINGGALLFEIQQRSDLTYRLFDYGRLEANGQPRTLHLDRALAVASLEPWTPPAPPLPSELPYVTALVSCPHFVLERWAVDRPIEAATDPGTFEIITAVQGEVTLNSESGSVVLLRGGTAVLPAALGRYQLEGAGAIVRCYLPASLSASS